VTSESRDDGFHEIQLNGKQLVFLFMAATVVSVVIFLCGVLVGRGVRVERSAVVENASLSEPPSADPSPSSASPAPAAVASDPRTAPPPTASEDLSYFNRLERSNQPVEELKPAAAKPAAKPAPAEPKAADKPAADHGKTAAAAPAKEPPAKDSKEKDAPAPAAAPPPAGSGYAVQVAALNVRSEADAIAKKLTSKGYAAYVQTPSDGTPSVYRVRIGTFKTRREAETVAARLQKEEQYKPWVTR
jgi:cell division septation protein DedD